MGVGGRLLSALIEQGHGDRHRMPVAARAKHAAGFYRHGFTVESEESIGAFRTS